MKSNGEFPISAKFLSESHSESLTMFNIKNQKNSCAHIELVSYGECSISTNTSLCNLFFLKS